MQDWIVSVMNQFGYWGIIFLIIVENVFPPIPSEVILAFGGFMTTFSGLRPWGIILVSTVGSVAGAMILYVAGRLISPERLEKLLSMRIFRLLGFEQGDVMKSVGWFTKHGKTTVLFCRCVPIVRSLISIPAGMAKMNIGLFLIYTAVGSFVWNTLLTYLGVAAGASWEKIVGYMDSYSTITVVVLGAAGAVGALIFVKCRIARRKKKEQDALFLSDIENTDA